MFTFTIINNPGSLFAMVGNVLQTAVSMAGRAGDYRITIRKANTAGFVDQDWTVSINAAGDITRIAPITTSLGGRPNVTPFSFFEGGQDELADPNEHPMPMSYTHMSVQSGLFSAPSTWSTGTVPGAGSVWRISAGHTVTYDMERDTIMKDGVVAMGATLRWADNRDTRMRIDFLMTMGALDMRDGLESTTPGKPRHEVVFHATEAPLATARLGLMAMGPARILGSRKTAHLRVGLTGAQTVPAVAAGATTIRLTGLETSRWRVGDVLHIVGTEYVLPATSDPQYTGPSQYWSPGRGVGSLQVTMNTYQFGQDEERTITAISGDTVTINAPLSFNHTGITGTLTDGKVVTMAPVVMNMSRSILFRSASAAEDGTLDPGADLTDLQKRAHIMFMRHPDVDTRYFALKNMGRSENDPTMTVPGLLTTTINPLRATDGGTILTNPINITGRWALHYHWGGGPYSASNQVNCIGAVAYAPIGAVPIPGWAIVQHGTRMSIEDCNISNYRGAGMVSEQGNEIGQWVNNCVTGGRGHGDTDVWGSRAEMFAKQHGGTGVAYDNQSRSVLMHGNIAGSSQQAYQWHASKVAVERNSPRDLDMRLIDGLTHTPIDLNFTIDTDVYGAVNAQIPPMLHNEAWACRFGMQVIHRQGQARMPDKTPMLVEDFHCINVPFPMDIPEYSNSYYFKDCLWQGPLNMMGSSIGATLGDVTWDWNFANMHLRNYGLGFLDDGAGLNYEGHIIDVTWENVTSFGFSPFRTVSGTHPTRDVMGPWVVNPGNSGQWRIRTYASEPSTALPSPYPLAPYGAKLPGGFPAVPVGGTPYFVLGDGTNGAASPGLSLTLTAGGGRNQGALYGIIRDSVGDRRYPDWQSSETYPNNVSIKGPRNLSKGQPEQLVIRNGCWQDGGIWRTRTHHFGADRCSHVRFVFSVDWVLNGFPAAFLAAHNLGGPPAAPVWPDALEAVPPVQPAIAPITKTLRFLSRTRAEAVAGQPLAHRLRPNEVVTSMTIVGGADAARFEIVSQRLRWVSNGTRPLDGSDANGDNVYEVRIRVADHYGNSAEVDHQIVMVSAAQFATSLTDNFNRANENLVANPAYLMLQGPADALRIVSNQVENFAAGVTPTPTASLVNLGTSEQQVTFSFPDWGRGSLVFRMVDADNFLAFSRNDAANRLDLLMRLAGVSTTIAQLTNNGGGTMTLRVWGNRLTLARADTSTFGPNRQWPLSYQNVAIPTDGLFIDAGQIELPANSPRGTLVGIRSGGANGPAIDNFAARAL